MDRVQTGATGLAGKYKILTSGGVDGCGAFFRTHGLSFGQNFATSGGAVVLKAFGTTGDSGSVILGAALDAGTHTGTLYTSYLISFEARTLASTASVRLAIGATTPGASSYFVSNAKHAGGMHQSSVDYDNGGASLAVGTASFVNGTTYLFVNCFTNVGDSGGVATTWILDVSDYDALVEAGKFSEAALDAHSRAKITQQAGSRPQVFDDTRFIQFGSSSGMIFDAKQIAVVDEVRYGTELSDVLSAIPEPSIYAVGAPARSL